MSEPLFKNLDEAADFMAVTVAAQSMLLASILRAFIIKGLITETDLDQALSETERAALERGTPETPALTGLIDLLRRDLGFAVTTDHDA